ncbi:hypothetical protein QQ045_016621 [Rhodiola kirilowii]
MGACLSIGVKAQTPIHLGIEENESRNISTKLVNKEEILKSSNLKIFCFDDLKSVTKNFRPDSVVGEDRFGQVFKGLIDEQTFTVVKPEERFQGQSEWLAEIKKLGLLDHPCLVKLIGYCLQYELRLLVYEFMANGSLEDHLFRSEFFPLSWNNRMIIALDAANGLAFIHSDEVKLIYGALKTSDILLDSKNYAKISYLGLPLDGPISKLSPFCARARIIRTNVYAAPEHDETVAYT